MIFTAGPALDEEPVWQMLAAAAGSEIIGVRAGSSDRQDAVIAGVAGMRGECEQLLPLHPGSIVSTRELARLLDAWGADAGVMLAGSVAPQSLLDAPRRGTFSISHGWIGAHRDPASPEEVAAAIRFVATARAPQDCAVDIARAPVYRDDTLGDLERRGEELAAALVRATLLRAADDASWPVRKDIEIHSWPTGAARARAAGRRQLRRAWRRATDPTWLAKSALAVLLLVLVAPLRHAWRSVLRRHPVRVFTFHRVTELCRDGMSVRPAVFQRQIAAICRSHRVVRLDEAIALVRGGTALRRPVAALTFDDAYRSVATTAAPVLARAGVPGCCFVSTGLVGPAHRFAHDEASPVRALLEVVSWEDLDMLHRAGWLIGGHTVTHARLSHCEAPALERELVEPLAQLRERYASDSTPFAYPFGGKADITSYARHLVRTVGYSACLSDHGGENSLAAADPFAMQRIEIGGDHPALAWRVRVQGMDLAAWRPRWLRAARDSRVAHAA